MSVFVASPSFTAGTTSNAISVSAPQLGASVGGYYAPVATATSKDVVVVALDPTSSGCSVSAGRVTFTAAGECVVTFNDVGNATYATAPQISQSTQGLRRQCHHLRERDDRRRRGWFLLPGRDGDVGDVVT